MGDHDEHACLLIMPSAQAQANAQDPQSIRWFLVEGGAGPSRRSLDGFRCVEHRPVCTLTAQQGPATNFKRLKESMC